MTTLRTAERRYPNERNDPGGCQLRQEPHCGSYLKQHGVHLEENRGGSRGRLGSVETVLHEHGRDKKSVWRYLLRNSCDQTLSNIKPRVLECLDLFLNPVTIV